MQAIQKLSEISIKAEESFTPNENFDALVQREREESYKYGGRTVFGEAKPFKKPSIYTIYLLQESFRLKECFGVMKYGQVLKAHGGYIREIINETIHSHTKLYTNRGPSRSI